MPAACFTLWQTRESPIFRPCPFSALLPSSPLYSLYFVYLSSCLSSGFPKPFSEYASRETCVSNVFQFEINSMYKRLLFRKCGSRKVNVMLFLNQFYLTIILFMDFIDFPTIFSLYFLLQNTILNALFDRINMSSKIF